MDEQPEQRRQSSLFDGAPRPELPPLGPDSPISVARAWWERRLEQDRRPRNTVLSYLSDLALFAERANDRPIGKVTGYDITRFLGDAQSRSTRKRRLTTLSSFFKWLTIQTKVLDHDPTAEFYPEHIPLKMPRPLSPSQQEAYMEAAAEDAVRTELVCWLLLRLGLTRAELLALQPGHIEAREDGSALVFIRHEAERARGRERALEAVAPFGEVYQRYLDSVAPEGALIEMLPQSINKLTDRVARLAGIKRRVTPQTLRDTFAVDAAIDGLDEAQLLALLGLADDHRNRASVQRYLRLAGSAQDSGAKDNESV